MKPILSSQPVSRRTALRRSLIALGSAPFIRSLGAGAEAPANRIHLACIGVGTHGLGVNLRSFLHEDAARVVAVCDAFRSRADAAKTEVDAAYGTKDCRVAQDFRELLARADVDAVVISTPDHWHVPMSLLALAAGKHVFCEKPTLTIASGRQLVEAVRKTDRVYQVGLEDRSLQHYHRLAELVRNGAIGELKSIHVKLPAGHVQPKEVDCPPPADLDWNLWTGPAPLSPYSSSRTNPEVWRQIRDYSGGKLADWGAHLIDTAQVANGAESSGPVEVEGSGEKPVDALTTQFVKYRITYRYANDVRLEVESGGIAIRFEGTAGWIGNNGWQGGLEASDPELLKPKYPPETSKLWPRPPREHRNFLDCIRSGAPTTYTAEAGQRLSTVMHIGNIAMELGRKLAWDPATETFPGDEAANALRARPERVY